LATSEVKTGLHVSLQAGRAARVAGRVTRETGEPVSAGTVMLAYSFPGATSTVGSRSVRTQSDGTFQFKNVAGGTYMVMAGGGASQQVVASGADIDEVQLVVRRGSTVTGSVIAEDGTVPPFATSGVRVLLEAPLGNVLPTVRVVSVEADWSFTLEGLGGPFLFRLGGLPADWVLGSVRLGDEEITDQPWDVPTGGQQLRGLTLAVTQKVSKVSGDVLDAAGKPTADAVIVIFADEPGLWLPNSRFIQTARPGSDGKFSMSGLPAGAYRALALAVIEDGQAEDPEFLEQVRAGAVTFTLAEGGKETLALKLPKK
jgi:hypothetical protein